MRISSFQRKAILDSVAVEFEQDIRVTLFGSRVNDFSRGGDIDLFVELPSLSN